MTISVGVVDVPGHEDFVKNMVAGVGSIDLALLVVAADDGWMPQTEEHLQILHYLGVSHAVIALTKIDLATGSESQIVERLRARLRGTAFETAPIVSTSVVTSQGIEELKTALASALAEMPSPADAGKPRLPIDRVFTLRGIGTVVTGTLSGGTLRRGQPVMLQPSGQATRIRSLHSHNHDVEGVASGTRAAINLPDVNASPDTAGHVANLARGEVVTVSQLGGGSDTVDALLEKSNRLLNSADPAARPLKDGALVRIHHGSAHTLARVRMLDASILAPGQRVLAQLRMESPLFVLAGDRFIVRDSSQTRTLAGGTVLEVDGQRRHLRRPEHLRFLQQRAQAPLNPLIFAETQLTRDRALRRADLLLRTRFSAEAAVRALDELTRQQKAVSLGDWVMDTAWWRSVRQRAADLIEAEHRSHSERLGLNLNDLRTAIEKDLPSKEVWEVLQADLCRTEFVQTGAIIRAARHRPALPPQLQAAGDRLRVRLAEKPFEPPARKELCPDAASQQALRFLVQNGEAIELSDDTVLGTEGLARARDSIRHFLQQRGAATASDLRQFLGTSRRVIIPLLERLDREGVTVRRGDQRVLKRET